MPPARIVLLSGVFCYIGLGIITPAHSLTKRHTDSFAVVCEASVTVAVN